jgi:hypothetical protein
LECGEGGHAGEYSSPAICSSSNQLSHEGGDGYARACGARGWPFYGRLTSASHDPEAGVVRSG